MSSHFLVWHSHMVITFQPSSSSARTFFLSLFLFVSSFSVQKRTLLFGRCFPYLQLCLCQKQPWTKMQVRCFCKTISGLPGRSRRCNLNLNPLLCRYFLTRISGLVSFGPIPDIIRLLTSLLTISMDKPLWTI